MNTFLNNFFVFCDAPRAWGVYFQDSASPQMEALVELHDNIMFYLVIILFGVGWILVSIIRNYGNKYLSHGTLIELIWTITPALILILIAFPSFKLLYLMDEVTDPSLTVFVEGHQWYWSYQYPDFLNEDEEELVLGFSGPDTLFSTNVNENIEPSTQPTPDSSSLPNSNNNSSGSDVELFDNISLAGHLEDKCLRVHIQRLAKTNPNVTQSTMVTLTDIITKHSPTFERLCKFADEYDGDQKNVQIFCRKVLASKNSTFKELSCDINIRSFSQHKTSLGSKIIDAIRNHPN